MNQSQLIDIIGNRDVVTLIQDYMCGTPLKKDKRVEKKVYRCYDNFDSGDSDSEIDEDTIDERDVTTFQRDEKISRVLKAKKQSIKINHNVHSKRREILGIPNVPRKPMYALRFTPMNRPKTLRILHQNNYNFWKAYKNSERETIEVIIPYPVEEYVDYLSDLIGIYEFEQRDISRKYYLNQSL